VPLASRRVRIYLQHRTGGYDYTIALGLDPRQKWLYKGHSRPTAQLRLSLVRFISSYDGHSAAVSNHRDFVFKFAVLRSILEVTFLHQLSSVRRAYDQNRVSLG
jgi:hypothetical protein